MKYFYSSNDNKRFALWLFFLLLTGSFTQVQAVDPFVPGAGGTMPTFTEFQPIVGKVGGFRSILAFATTIGSEREHTPKSICLFPMPQHSVPTTSPCNAKKGQMPGAITCTTERKSPPRETTSALLWTGRTSFAYCSVAVPKTVMYRTNRRQSFPLWTLISV